MDQQVSPAVVIIVLILIVAILVGLYFLVVERSPQVGEGEPAIDIGPIDDMDAEMLPDGIENEVVDEGDEQNQEDADAERTDVESEADAEGTVDDDEVGERAAQ